MNEQALCAATLQDELPRFVRVFKAFSDMPIETLSYKHPNDGKSKTAIQLIITMAVEASVLPIILNEGVIDFKNAYAAAPTTLEEAIPMFEMGFTKAVELAKDMDDANWNSEASMSGEGEWKSTKGKMLFAFLLDLIHHRGQLSTYIRPMGGKVPSIYGPSADTQE